MAENGSNAEGDILDDLAITYLMHLPQLEYTSASQLFYAFEQAWWHYSDQHQKHDASLRGYKTLQEFISVMVQRVPGLHSLRPKLQALMQEFRELKRGTPAYGAILLNQALDKVLLVQFVGKSADSGGAWSFPRGKIESKDHGDAFQCAMREVFEETGLDITPHAINDKAHFFQSTVATGSVSKQIGMFIVPGVDEHYAFAAQCDGEIQSFAWFHIDDVAKVHAGLCTLSAGAPPAKARFFQVMPFLRQMLHFALHNGSGPAKARAHAGLQALRAQATEGGTLGSAGAAAPAQKASASSNNAAAAAPGLLSGLQGPGAAPADFDEMVRLNAQLRDRMQPYQGTAPPPAPSAQPVPPAALRQPAASQIRQRAASAQQQVQAQQGATSAPQQAPARQRGALAQQAQLRGLSQHEQGLTYDELLAMNAMLGQRDALPTYDGALPTSHAKRSEAAAPPAAGAPLVADAVQWQPVHLILPAINFDAAHLAAAAQRCRHSVYAVQPAPDDESAVVSRTWATFKLDTGQVTQAIKDLLEPG